IAHGKTQNCISIVYHTGRNLKSQRSEMTPKPFSIVGGKRHVIEPRCSLCIAGRTVSDPLRANVELLRDSRLRTSNGQCSERLHISLSRCVGSSGVEGNMI